jgi:hypothetical protein
MVHSLINYEVPDTSCNLTSQSEKLIFHNPKICLLFLHTHFRTRKGQDNLSPHPYIPYTTYIPNTPIYHIYLTPYTPYIPTPQPLTSSPLLY